MRRPEAQADLNSAGVVNRARLRAMNPPLTHPPLSAPPLTTPPTGPAPEHQAPEHQAPEHQASLEHLLLRFGLVTLDQLSAAMREQTETGTPYTDALVRDGILKAEDLARVADRAPAQPEPEPAPEPPPLAAEIAPQEAPTAVIEPVVHEPVAIAPAPEPLVVPPPVAVAPEPVFVPPPVAVAPEPVFVPPPVAVQPEPVSGPTPVLVPEPAPAPVVTGFVVRGCLVNGEEIEIASVDDAATAQRIARDAMRACARSEGTDWPILNGRYVRPDSIVSIEVSERF
jgi:hypothetical protein